MSLQQPSLFDRPAEAYWRKRIVGVEVYRFQDKETYSMYLSVIIYRASFDGWARLKSYRLFGRRQRRYWQLVDAMRRAWESAP